MDCIGIIAEYNPFHSGHRHHLQELRRVFGSDCAIVCVMSGNWVQRGDAALVDKWIRARLAMQGGVDLVLELPTLWAVSSAESFARGGVFLLSATGVVDILSFGSEAGDLRSLQQAAEVLDGLPWRLALREGLEKGLSFPAARQKAAEAQLGPVADCLRTPNNSLGVEYLRALRHWHSDIVPHTIPRLGAGHDVQTQDCHVSASYLRSQILTGKPTPLSPYLSNAEEAVLRQDPAGLRLCTQGVLARLRAMEETDFAHLPDCGEGLDHRLFAAVQESSSLDDLYDRVKTKRYTHARIRRMVLWAFLGLKQEDRPETPPYLRVLGFSSRGQELLRQMKRTASRPVLVKPAHAAKLPLKEQRLFALEARCTSLYDLCRTKFGQAPGKNEYRQTPVRL